MNKWQLILVHLSHPAHGFKSLLLLQEVDMKHLNFDEKSYYLRHFSLPGFDENTQLKLKNSSVLVIGCGGLGVPCLLYLAGTGIGRIGIVDCDVISASNLPRQVLFDYKDIGGSKIKHACQRITALNPFIHIDEHKLFIKAHNAREILRCYDIVVDCTDNFDTKYLLNDICEELNKPLVYASIFQYEGQLAVFHYGNKFGDTISYRDLFPAPPQPEFRENCSDAGVLGVLPGILGTMQAGEVIKIVTGIGQVLCDQVMTYDSLSNRSSLLKLAKRIPSSLEVAEQEIDAMDHVNPAQLLLMKERDPGLLLLDVREKSEREIISIGGIHIPLRELPDRLGELPRERQMVCYCKSGGRSKRAVMFLQDQDFSNICNLTGGVMGLTKSEKEFLQNMDWNNEI